MTDTLEPKEVATYHRNSKKVGQTIEVQERMTRMYCESRGIKNYKVYTEKESSRETRPIKEQLLQRALKGEIEQIVVSKFDRWARTTPELILNINDLTAAGVNFVSVTEGVDLKTPAGRLMVGIIASVAQFEREQLRERTIDGLDLRRDALANDGYFISKKGRKVTKLGRPKGSKDKKRRCRSGYWQRYAGKNKKESYEIPRHHEQENLREERRTEGHVAQSRDA